MLVNVLHSFTDLSFRVILDFRYIGIFHILSVFIILGIGADDVFIFMDTWKETGHHQVGFFGKFRRHRSPFWLTSIHETVKT